MCLFMFDGQTAQHVCKRSQTQSSSHKVAPKAQGDPAPSCDRPTSFPKHMFDPLEKEHTNSWFSCETHLLRMDKRKIYAQDSSGLHRTISINHLD